MRRFPRLKLPCRSSQEVDEAVVERGLGESAQIPFAVEVFETMMVRHRCKVLTKYVNQRLVRELSRRVKQEPLYFRSVEDFHNEDI